MHGPIGCAGSSWDNRGSVSAGPALNRLGFTTDLNEQDVIMGRGERRLFHAVRHIVDRYRPAAVFIYNTCVPAMEGDDIEAVCRPRRPPPASRSSPLTPPASTAAKILATG